MREAAAVRHVLPPVRTRTDLIHQWKLFCEERVVLDENRYLHENVNFDHEEK